jgi:hypothetical protein
MLFMCLFNFRKKDEKNRFCKNLLNIFEILDH